MDDITKSGSFKRSVVASLLIIIAYVITFRFYAMWWFFIVFIDLVLFLMFLVVTLGSIIFFIRNSKSFKYPFVPLSINIITILIVVYSPSIERNKSYYRGTMDLNKNRVSVCKCHLYIETYCIYGGGALNSDMDSLYLTDSLNFRKYIGTYDEGDEMIITKCNDDKVFIEKRERGFGASPQWDTLKVTERKVLSLKDLKRRGGFE